MCIELNSFRLQSYSHAMAQVLRLLGASSIWDRDLQRDPIVRGLAFEGRLGKLDCLLSAARFHAGLSGLDGAVSLLTAKLAEIHAAKEEAASTVDVIVLDDDWGKKGRGVKIKTWIMATGADATAVAKKFQLARSTAQKYVRDAKKQTQKRKAA